MIESSTKYEKEGANICKMKEIRINRNWEETLRMAKKLKRRIIKKRYLEEKWKRMKWKEMKRNDKL